MENYDELIKKEEEFQVNTTSNTNNKNEEPKSKRGRKKKSLGQGINEIKDQNKFFIDVSKDESQRELIQNILREANNKSYGREIILKDLVLIALPKITQKEILRLQETSLSEMERVSMALDEYNKKSETKLSLGEFLVKKLSL
ncbi:MAG: hypothetical protein H6621_00420 [Halobacteriovoraceae bacterium]|nr:hypothetical protein [Halobacteriovoraceae bacterium]